MTRHYKKGGRYISPAGWVLTAGGFSLILGIYLCILERLCQPDVSVPGSLTGVLSAKIYRVGVLLYGTTPRIGSILKSVWKA